jgi:glycosyltransferase involved in cell wall biosynthesis
MTTSRHYTLITPRLDDTGPCNVAVDIGRAAASAGWTVSLRYLSGDPSRNDLAEFRDVRQLRLSDLANASGVIHTHCLRPDLLGWLFTFNSKCTVVTTLHNHFLIDLSFDHAPWKVRLAWRLWSAALRRFDHRVCISQTMRRYYRRLMPDLEFDVAYNFRSNPEASGRPQDAPPDLIDWLRAQRLKGRIVLAYVGSLTQRKNLAPLIEALAAEREMALILCGRGNQKADLERASIDLGLGDRVLFLGQVASPREVVRMCDALILPSLAEGLPLAVLEAASVGRPSLMSNITVHRELARLGVGATFDHRRFSDFAAQVRTVMCGRPSGQGPDPGLQSLWRDTFSSEVGFRRYETLLGEGSRRPRHHR